jgi:hypothetical protein
MASYEPSEIATAAALMYSNKELMDYAKDRSGLITLIEDAKKKLEKMPVQGGIVQFGSAAIKTGFIKEMNERDDKFINDMATGISAAIGVRNHVMTSTNAPTNKPGIYMTGDSWPDEVEPFRVSAYGFADYNSSDIMVTGDKKTFYGVSLKKKAKPEAPDPTLINKAFDTALDEKGLKPDELRKVKALKSKVVETRIKYFSDVVIEAVEKGIIRWQDITKENGQKLKSIGEWNTWKNTDAGRKELFDAKKRDKALFGKYSYIDTKGYANHANGYLHDKTTDPNSMRYFVNKKLSDSNNELWTAFLNVMNEYADVFADILINIILKTKLYEELDAKQIEKQGYKFGFFLVSGIGNVNKKGEVTISPAQVIPLETTLCGLTRIEQQFKNSKYEIVLDKEQQAKSDAAKIFFKLKRGNVNILDMEIRYKGSFNPQPQFQGTINDQYKKLLKSECGI